MAPPATSPARAGRPPRLSRSEIVAAARAIIDDGGLETLTMRRLARAMGSTPMALYHHVRSKDDLLVLLLDDYAAAIPAPELPADPAQRIVAAAVAMHDAVAGCPWVTEALTADTVLSRTGLRYPEAIVGAVVDCGLSAEHAVRVYRTIWYYTAGEILVHARATRRRDQAEGPNYRDEVFASVDPQTTPNLAALADRWIELSAQDTYREGLQAIVDGFLGRLST